MRLVIACLTGMAAVSLIATPSNEELAAQAFGLTKYVAPQFPTMAEDQAVAQGFATIAIAWQSDGTPSDVIVLRASEREFGQTTREAALNWRRAPSGVGREVVVYEMKFAVSGVIICRTSSATTQFAANQPLEVPPLRVPSAAELDSPLKPIAQPMPAFPASAKGKWDEGTVVVEFYVDQDGHVRAPTVRESTAAEFSTEALNAIQQWQFETPRKNGQPAVMSGRWAFQFHRTS